MAKVMTRTRRGLARPNLRDPGTAYCARGQTITPWALRNRGGACTYAITSGSVPGVSLDANTGVFSGTVTGSGATTVAMTVTATNAAGTHSVSFTWDIKSAYATISSASTFPYYTDAANKLYILSENVSSNGSGVVFSHSNVALDLNGYTLKYNNSSRINIVNHSFEYGSGTAATGWDFTNAPNATRHAGNYLYSEMSDGTYSLKFSNTTANEYVENTTDITLEPNTTYCLSAMFEYGGQGTDANPGVKMYVQLISDSLATIEVSRNTANSRGIQLVEYVFTTGGSSDVRTVRAGIVGHASGTVPAYIDDIRVTKYKVHGVVTSAKSWNPTETPDVTTYATSNNSAIVNGTIEQGDDSGAWCHGVWFYGTSGTTIHDVTIRVRGNNCSCLYGRDEGTFTSTITHNTLDSGCRNITSRDAFDGAVMYRLQGTVTDNYVTDGCHAGLVFAAGIAGNRVINEIARNTIKLRARYTNPFAIYCGYGAQVHDNHIACGNGQYTARGIAVTGIGDQPTALFNNRIEIQTLANNQEYEGVSLGGMYGIQLEDVSETEVYGNTVTAYATEGEAFAFRQNNTFSTGSNNNIYSNTFRAFSRNGNHAGCLKLSDLGSTETNIYDNHLVTNDAIVGATSNTTCTIMRPTIEIIDAIVSPHPFECDYASGTALHVDITLQDPEFVDSTSATYVSNADVRSPALYGSGVNTRGAFAVWWSQSLRIRAAGGGVAASAGIVIDDATATEVVNTTADSGGMLAPVLRQFRTVGNTKTTYTPHDITVTHGAESATGSVTADGYKITNIQTA